MPQDHPTARNVTVNTLRIEWFGKVIDLIKYRTELAAGIFMLLKSGWI